MIRPGKLLLLIFCFLIRDLKAEKPIILFSPDGNIEFRFSLAHGDPKYEVSFKKNLLILASELGLHFREVELIHQLKLIEKPKFSEGIESYELPVGKNRIVREQYKEAEISLTSIAVPGRKLIIRVRAFNDGLAFRYELPAQPGWDSFELVEEHTSFRLATNPTVHALFLPNYTSSHEGEYTTSAWDKLKEDSLMDMPALLEFPGHIFMGITEAALLDYAGMYLMKEKDKLRCRLSPLPGQDLIKVRAKLPHQSPWRVLLLSDRIGSLIESNLLTNLSPPCAIRDLSWLRPGKTTFPWWNGNVVPDTINAPGNNFVTQQYYIDFCARNGIDYHSVVEYGLHQWYVDDGIPFSPGPHADVTRAVPGLDMKEVCDYAKSKGVGIRVWVHFFALYPKLDTAFALFEKWGISGMMVDFMDRDDQDMVNMQTEILQKAAAHHLHIQFHGAYKPTGLSRTYPNEFTREGTLNYESNKWSKRVTPDHDIQFPFTRMLAGSTDYHLGGFRFVTDSAFIVQYTRPLIISTRSHMLGMYVVLENYLGMVCDYPAAYEGQSGFDFICQVPTIWDQTKVLDAKVGEYILIARKKNDQWWLGAINNHQPRSISFSLKFLDPGQYEMTMYRDAPDADVNPNHLIKEIMTVDSGQTLQINMSVGGGAAFHFKKKG
jgi:alpha-glucosidase